MLTLDPSDIGQIRMMMQSAGTWYTDEEGNINLKDNQGLKDAIDTYQAILDAGFLRPSLVRKTSPENGQWLHSREWHRRVIL